jgi:hypothetical protein
MQITLQSSKWLFTLYSYAVYEEFQVYVEWTETLSSVTVVIIALSPEELFPLNNVFKQRISSIVWYVQLFDIHKSRQDVISNILVIKSKLEAINR